jgi:acetoin utilization protein AcuC
MRRAALVASPSVWESGRGRNHPLKPERIERTWDLLHAYKAFDSPSSRIVEPRPATDAELAWIHAPSYIDVVKRLGRGDHVSFPARYGFGPGDNPISPGMYDTEALKTGAGIVAMDLVLSGKADVAFNIGGGMHHAGAARASGFCVFNDTAIAIEFALRQGKRVVYLDIDAHHGDGVQEAFYETDQVLTISLHESGRYLFPGTGFEREIGKGTGKGYSVNVPLPPYTTDDPYLWAFQAIVSPLVRRFAPDVLVAQLGADTHMQDPLTHLALTVDGMERIYREIVQLCPRLVATGGGGYEVTVVPRAWTLAYGIFSEQRFDDKLPAAYAETYESGTLHDNYAPVTDDETTEMVRREIGETIANLKLTFGI